MSLKRVTSNSSRKTKNFKKKVGYVVPNAYLLMYQLKKNKNNNRYDFGQYRTRTVRILVSNTYSIPILYLKWIIRTSHDVIKDA